MSMFNIAATAERLRPWIIKTPLIEMEALSERSGKKVYLKLESLQRTGAFKFRGAMNYLLKLDEAAAQRGVITASSGNHGLGLSLGSKLRGIKCTVVMPLTAPLTKQARAKAYGATLVLQGTDYDAAQEHAAQLAEHHGYTYVPSFNHPAVIEGQGTIFNEVLTELPQVDLLLAPVGGGGLISGLLLAREQSQANPAIIGVEPTGAASMQASLAAGNPTLLQHMDTIADGVAVRIPGQHNLEIVQRFNPPLWQVSDSDILAAQQLLLQEPKLIVETAGAVPVAGLLTAELPPQVETVVCVISGANLDLSSLLPLL